MSFESAMIRLGGNILGANDPSTTSAAKGETLGDTVRVLENYSDLIVIRHPNEGAARVAATFAKVPVINGGDGGHEHPTQTLCDLYTLRREKKALKDLTVLLFGDLRNGRTVHSLVYALARFGASIVTLPMEGLELPPHVKKRLETDYGCVAQNVDLAKGKIGAIYMAPFRSHQLSLLPTEDVELELNIKLAKQRVSQIDVCYVTRLQKERLSVGEKIENYSTVNKEFLKDHKYKTTSVLHPLPRREELGYDLDQDPRGVYFKQAAYGVPVRMALIAMVLGLKPFPPECQIKKKEYRSCISHKNGVKCGNHRCVTYVENEAKYLPLKFWIVNEESFTLRCVYCEHEINPKVVGDIKVGKYYSDLESFGLIPVDQLIIFMDEHNAIDAKYTKGFKKKNSSESHI